MPRLRHYKFREVSNRTFYVPITSPKGPDNDVTAQLFEYFKAHDINVRTLTILQTSTREIHRDFMSWYMSREYDLAVRAEFS